MRIFLPPIVVSLRPIPAKSTKSPAQYDTYVLEHAESQFALVTDRLIHSHVGVRTASRLAGATRGIDRVRSHARNVQAAP
jgi:hypothetical protein